MKWSAAAVYGGGADTVSEAIFFVFEIYPDLAQTVSANCSFYLAMTLYPEIQRRAQEELDRVIGTERLPTFSDRKNLPYIDALVKEAIRWHPVAPLGKSNTVTAAYSF